MHLCAKPCKVEWEIYKNKMLPVYLYEQFSSVLFLSTDENCICGCCTAIGFVFATMPLTGVVLLGWSSFEFHG